MVFLGFTGFYWVEQGFTGFYWVLIDFMKELDGMKMYKALLLRSKDPEGGFVGDCGLCLSVVFCSTPKSPN